VYSLLVAYTAHDLSVRDIAVPLDRFLEYTDGDITSQIETLSHEAIDFLSSHPCLLMEEGRGEEVARVVKLTQIAPATGSIRVRFDPILCTPPLNNSVIWKLREALDIEQFEFSRNHFAFKTIALSTILKDAGYVLESSALNELGEFSLPAPSRSALIAARTALAELGHSQIDDLLLRIGNDSISAGRDCGSRRDRADALLKFALENPGAKTAENNLLSVFLVRAAGPRLSESKVQEAVSASLAVRSPSRKPVADGASNRVFIVHGQDDGARSSVVAFLDGIGLEGVVLHEQPNMGRHLLTKFIDEAELTTFAVILMTADDVGSRKGDSTLAPRARQNVILELGYFLSHLGQERVCALIAPGLETPSDFDGIVYIRMDEGQRWKEELKRELIAARMPVAP
jgi:predicted nucleotide-binding protein